MAELAQNYVTAYSKNVYTMAQQKESRLRPYVTVVPMEGQKKTFELVKPTTAVKIESRYSDTQVVHTEFGRRTVHATAYGISDTIDWQDKLDLLIDPTSAVVAAGAYALGRSLDKIIIEGAFQGDALEGVDGTTKVALPEKQKIPVTFGGTSGSNVGLNLAKLYEIRSRFGKADIDINDPRNQICMAVTQSQIDDLSRDIDSRNADFSAFNKFLIGETDKFLGIKFIMCGELPLIGEEGDQSRMCVAWCKSGVVLAMQKEVEMSIFQNHQKWDNWQYLAKMKGGATRLEDAKLVQVFCQEAQ